MLADLSFVRLLITFLFATTWFLAAFGKFATFAVPEWFLKQFENSFIAKFPGTTAAYWTIGFIEAISCLLCVMSLFRMEFFVTADPVYLKWAMVSSMLIFLMLGFGLRLTNDFVGAANSFQYFVGTLLCYGFLELVTKPI